MTREVPRYGEPLRAFVGALHGVVPDLRDYEIARAIGMDAPSLSRAMQGRAALTDVQRAELARYWQQVMRGGE